MKIPLLLVLFSSVFSTGVAYAYVDSIIIDIPQYDLEIVTKVASPDDCYGKHGNEN